MEQPRYIRSSINVGSDHVMILDAVDLNLARPRHTHATNRSTRFTLLRPSVVRHHNLINEVQTTTRNTETIERHSYRYLSKIRVEEGMESEEMMCSICLVELLVGTQATRLRCSHLYHEGCIMKWLGRSNTCPLCRQIVHNMWLRLCSFFTCFNFCFLYLFVNIKIHSLLYIVFLFTLRRNNDNATLLMFQKRKIMGISD